MVPSFKSLSQFYTKVFKNDQKTPLRQLQSSQHDGRLLNPFVKRKPEAAAAPSGRILIVDDDTLNVMGLREVIQANHADVIIETANSGQEALDIAKSGLNEGHHYRLVFMDL